MLYRVVTGDLWQKLGVNALPEANPSEAKGIREVSLEGQCDQTVIHGPGTISP